MQEPVTIYQNKDFLVLDKPAEWLSVPSRMGVSDERPCVGTWLQKKLGTQIWPVHRLDFEVSGLLIFALNAEAHRAGSKWFEKHQITKLYRAIVAGCPVPVGHESKWTSLLVAGKKRSFVAAHGSACETTVRALRTETRDGVELTHLDLQPHSGRRHQLRVECANHGSPIVGDKLYGSQLSWPDSGIALRAWRLDFSAIGERFNLPAAIETTAF